MQKAKKIIYWITTVWLALGMVSTGIVQLIQMDEEVTMVISLGFPTYLLTLIGVWKLLGSVVVLLPGFLRLKEWAYAGFFFTMSGAIFAHIASGHGPAEIFPPVLLLVLTCVSWYLRPDNRKLVSQS